MVSIIYHTSEHNTTKCHGLSDLGNDFQGSAVDVRIQNEGVGKGEASKPKEEGQFHNQSISQHCTKRYSSAQI